MCSAQEPDKLVRPPDKRPRVDAAELKTLGIELFQSRRLKLFTDIDADIAKTLPPLVDQAYEAWEEYFGKLPPDPDGNDFQVNGYLLKDKERFKKAGLLQKDLPDEFHGQQIGYQFWMMDQKLDYYRRHLLLHEATHAFMQAIPRLDVPLVYLEGMAEHFGTHRLSRDGTLELRVMPTNRLDFRGHDRLFLLRRDVARGNIPDLLDLGEWKPANFQFFSESYAWAWGACVFLDQHPRTRERFRETAKLLTDPLAWRKLELKLTPDLAEITTEWNLFAVEAWEGFDFVRMAIEFHDGKPLSELIPDRTKPHRCEIQSSRGWQSSGVLVEPGREYEVVASGQFTLAENPQPWVSEADGITLRYHGGRPLGRLLATIRPIQRATDEREPMRAVNSLGARARFEPSRTGTLYLRLNDHPGELADNRGSVIVEIRDVGQAQPRAAP